MTGPKDALPKPKVGATVVQRAAYITWRERYLNNALTTQRQMRARTRQNGAT